MTQVADFKAKNRKAALIREQAVLETLDELLYYILELGGSVGILDATNGTLEHRELLMRTVRHRAGLELNVMFVESVCIDQAPHQSNPRPELHNPEHREKGPVSTVSYFQKRLSIYKKVYVPLGGYEERNNMPYVKVADGGDKIVYHQVRGFLASQAAFYLLNSNTTPKQMWITRHGESLDNIAGKIGGDSDLTPNGRLYSKTLAKFIENERGAWSYRVISSHFPPHPGDDTPPLPDDICVWTSTLRRSIQSAEYFNEEDDFDVKRMTMLDGLNQGIMDGMTYSEIRDRFPQEYQLRQSNKLAYRYPGIGGESYLDIISRLDPVIIELERMTHHVLLITHKSVAQVLLAYFLALKRDEIPYLDCPLGMLYSLEPVSCHLQ
jgi:6-phosphofructo-2-kinase